MRLSIIFAFAAASLVTLSALPKPAAAMELREAIKRCDASAGCTYTLDKSGATIFGPKGGTVSCPPDGGQCQVMNHAGQKTKPPGGVKGVLSGATPAQGKVADGTSATAGKQSTEKKPIAIGRAGKMQSDNHPSTTGSGGGSKKH